MEKRYSTSSAIADVLGCQYKGREKEGAAGETEFRHVKTVTRNSQGFIRLYSVLLSGCLSPVPCAEIEAIDECRMSVKSSARGARGWRRAGAGAAAGTGAGGAGGLLL